MVSNKGRPVGEALWIFGIPDIPDCILTVWFYCKVYLVVSAWVAVSMGVPLVLM